MKINPPVGKGIRFVKLVWVYGGWAILLSTCRTIPVVEREHIGSPTMNSAFPNIMQKQCGRFEKGIFGQTQVQGGCLSCGP